MRRVLGVSPPGQDVNPRGVAAAEPYPLPEGVRQSIFQRQQERVARTADPDGERALLVRKEPSDAEGGGQPDGVERFAGPRIAIQYGRFANGKIGTPEPFNGLL